MRRLPPAVAALSPGDLAPGRAAEFLERARAALGAGIRGLVLREPSLSDREYLELALRLGAACRELGAWWCVHDRVHLATEVGADAVQLGFRSLTPAQARRVLPEAIAIGLSTHAGDDRSASADADFRVHGPVFDTPSKRGLKSAIGLDGLARETRASTLPLWAIGGLLPEHLGEVRARGARGAFARAAVFAADARETARRAAEWVRAEHAERAEPRGEAHRP